MDKSKMIEAGRQPRLTINDIARLAGVSKKTVSRVINGERDVRPATRANVAAVIAAHGYKPDPQARGLAFRKAFSLGLIYDNPNAQFIVNSQYGVLDAIRNTGFELVVHPCDRASPDFLADLRAFVEQQKPFGVILLPPVAEDEHVVALLRYLECNYVRISSAPLDDPDKMVSSDDRQASADAARHLIELGHRRIAFIRGPAGYRSADERWIGFSTQAAELGAPVAPEFLSTGGYTFESGVACAEHLLALDPRPTAIFASNDEMAAGVHYVAQALGISIPSHLSIIGFDDNPLATRMWPQLTTITRPIRTMSEVAARILVAKANGAPLPSVDTIVAHLTVRASTTRPDIVRLNLPSSIGRPTDGE